jgi:50S ribosomal subunit-associated GTPase HflX
MLRHYPRAVFTSAQTGAGLDELRSAILGVLRSRTIDVVLEIVRADAQEAVSFCHREGRVERQETSEEGRMRLHVNFPEVAFRRFVKTYSRDVRIVDVPSDAPAGTGFGVSGENEAS